MFVPDNFLAQYWRNATYLYASLWTTVIHNTAQNSSGGGGGHWLAP